MNASCDFYDVVSRLANFETHVLNLSAVFQGTPLESWYYESGWNTSEYRVVHLSDSLRYLLLWKNGGIYLDLDFIIVDSLNDTRNGAVYQAPDDPANGMLFFDRGHPFLLEVLNSIKDHYNRNAFSCIGPLLLKSIYKKLCETSKCLGVTMYPIKFAYPVPWQNWKEYFDPKLTSTILERSKEGRAVHFWNFLSSKRVVRTGDGSAYDMLANQNCPKTYTLMTEKGVF